MATSVNVSTSMDEHWMGIALAQARLAAQRGEVPVGAVVVGPEGELARAHNQPIALCDPTAHAEILALRSAALRVGAYRLPGTTLYATLEPCALCLGAALHARVERVVFGASDPKGGAAGSVVDLTALDGVNHSVDVTGGILAGASAGLLQAFFRAKRTRS